MCACTSSASPYRAACAREERLDSVAETRGARSRRRSRGGRSIDRSIIIGRQRCSPRRSRRPSPALSRSSSRPRSRTFRDTTRFVRVRREVLLAVPIERRAGGARRSVECAALALFGKRLEKEKAAREKAPADLTPARKRRIQPDPGEPDGDGRVRRTHIAFTEAR
eukprot:30087-Pelagococcus_subviridis.AAC.19